MSVLLFRVYCDVHENRDRFWLLPTNIRTLFVYASFMKYFQVRKQDCPHTLLSLQALILKSMTEFKGEKDLSNLFRSQMGNLYYSMFYFKKLRPNNHEGHVGLS